MNKPLSEADLVELEHLIAAATPGPWHDDGYRVYGPPPPDTTDLRSGDVLLTYKQLDDGFHGYRGNGPFAVAAREAMPRLIEELRFARKLLASTQDALKKGDP